MTLLRSAGFVALTALLATVALSGQTARRQPAPKDKKAETAEKWVERTLKAMTLDEQIGQLLVPSFESAFISTDSDKFDSLARLAREYHVGGFHVFGASEPAPAVLLNSTYGTVTLGHPLEAASTLNRLQAIAKLPLLNTADFETGVGMRILGGTTFPKAMAFGAARDERLAFEAGRITGVESRAIGIHVDFAPVADVNNNARNPVINTRSFGEDPALVGTLAGAFARGLEAAGVVATVKHFPGHGDTDVDSHLGLPIINQPRERIDRIELPPFKAGIAAGADAIMVAHIELPALDPAPGTPATLSRPIITGLLRGEMRFDGLIYTDSMTMDAVTKMMPPGEAAVRALKAGNDVILHSPDDIAAFNAMKKAVESGEVDREQVTASVKRILRRKAALGLHTVRTVDLEAVAAKLGGRANQAVAREVSERSITLIKDASQAVPLQVTRTGSILYLSLLDYPSGWRISAPSRTFIPELKKRWPSVTAIELSDRSTQSEVDLVRAMAPRFDAIVASVFVRTSAFSGRMDLAPPIVKLLTDLGKASRAERPLVVTFFGNPYVATFMADLPAMLLAYDFNDLAETSAVRALAGEIAIGGKLPIALPNMFPIGHGLERPVRRTSAP
jgi:beta-N-acetylhexosaminidase